MCARWAADKGFVVTRQLLFYGQRPGCRGLWADVDGGHVDLFVAPNERVLARALTSTAAAAAPTTAAAPTAPTAPRTGPAAPPPRPTAPVPLRQVASVPVPRWIPDPGER
jgi:hypothetical protein